MIVLFCSPGHRTEHDGGTLLSNEVGEILLILLYGGGLRFHWLTPVQRSAMMRQQC